MLIYSVLRKVRKSAQKQKLWQIISIIFGVLTENFYVAPFPCKFRFSFGGKFKFIGYEAILFLYVNRRSRIKMDKKIVSFFNFDIRWWVGPSTSKNHEVNFPAPLSFRKIKVFDKIFEKWLSPGFGHQNLDLHFLSNGA